MGICERIKSERVIYDELIKANEFENIDFSDTLKAIHATQISSIVKNESNTLVTPRACDFDYNTTTGDMSITVSFFVLKTIVVRVDKPTNSKITKEVSFNTPLTTIKLAKNLHDIYFPDKDLPKAHCQIFEIEEVQDTLTLNTNKTSIHDDLLISFMLKIVVDDQLVVKLCPALDASIVIGTT